VRTKAEENILNGKFMLERSKGWELQRLGLRIFSIIIENCYALVSNGNGAESKHCSSLK